MEENFLETKRFTSHGHEFEIRAACIIQTAHIGEKLCFKAFRVSDQRELGTIMTISLETLGDMALTGTNYFNLSENFLSEIFRLVENEIRRRLDEMDQDTFTRWINSGCCPGP